MNRQIALNNIKKGFEYEVQIRDHIINNIGDVAYLWQDVPELVLIKYGFINNHNDARLNRISGKNPLRDNGIDIIQIDNNGNCYAVQCKNGYGKNGVCLEDLGGFSTQVLARDHINGIVYYSEKLNKNIQDLPQTKRVQYIHYPYINSINNIIQRQPRNKFVVDKTKLVYQKQAEQLAIQHFKNNNRGILWGVCGIGKTYISYLISEHYDQIIIISPLRQFARQNLDKYIEYGTNKNHLLISSDGERDINNTVQFINNNKKFILSATYDSVDVIHKIINFTKNPLIIVDEFHGITKNNMTNKDDHFYKILHGDHKMLFMSATPRIYELENEEYDDKIFGKIIFKMSFGEAIAKKYITDYKIWIPSITETDAQLNKELSIYKINETIKSKCIYLFSCLLNNNSKKCIIYCTDSDEIYLMKKALTKLNEFYRLKLHINQITCDNTAKERKQILGFFAKSSRIELLLSINILTECIDIPSCDSIYITYPSQSKIRTIQRMCRCLRTDPNNKLKIGNIYMWCDKYESMLVTLSGLKEYDELFRNKIDININNFSGKTKLSKTHTIDKQLISEYIVGIQEYKKFSFAESRALLKEWCNINGKVPVRVTNHKGCNIGIWLSNRKIEIQNWMDKNKASNVMNNEAYKLLSDNPYVKQSLDQYFVNVKNNKGKVKLSWEQSKDLLFEYCNLNKKIPSSTEKYKDCGILKWLNRQKENVSDINSPIYKKLEGNTYVKQCLDKFITSKNNKKVTLSTQERTDILFDYCNVHKTTPTESTTCEEYDKLGEWFNKTMRKIKDKNSITYKRLAGNPYVKARLRLYLSDNKGIPM